MVWCKREVTPFIVQSQVSMLLVVSYDESWKISKTLPEDDFIDFDSYSDNQPVDI